MTDYSFYGITVIIPDDMQNVIEKWTAVKMAMTLVLDPPTPAEPVIKKPYTMTNRELKRRKEGGTKFHKGQRKK